MGTNVSTVKTIWVTDDDDEDLKIFIDTLNSLYPSVKLSGFSSGSKLIHALLNSEAPDLLFLDLYMPCTGKDCLATIRSEPKFDNLPIIIYSSSTNKTDISNAYKAGANLYIYKPYSYSDLCSIVEKVMHLDWSNLKEVTNTHYQGGKHVPFMAQ